jgi:hypothetical protein
MASRLALALTVSFVLVAGPAAQARPLCDGFPDPPICDAVEPGEPPVLEPVDPDACEVDPAACEPEDFSHVADLKGKIVAKGESFRKRTRTGFFFDFDAERFSMGTKSWGIDGTLVPLNEAGTKFSLVLDSVFDDPFATFVVEEALPPGTALPEEVTAESLTMTLKLRADGRAVLRIESDLLLQGTEAVHLKAVLSGPVEVPVKG